jgi:large subunit ribosomal protein L22
MEAVAKLKNVPSSPRKMRLVAGLVRGQNVTKALALLKFEANGGAEKNRKAFIIRFI